MQSELKEEIGIFTRLQEFISEESAANGWAYATLQCWTTFTHHPDLLPYKPPHLHLFRPFQRHPAAGGDEMAKADAMKLFDEELKK